MEYRTGFKGENYNRDMKHCCFRWELDYGLNLGLKQRKYIYGTIKGSISNFRSIFFYSFSFFSRLRFLPCPPVQYYTGHMFLISLLFNLCGFFYYYNRFRTIHSQVSSQSFVIAVLIYMNLTISASSIKPIISPFGCHNSEKHV